MCVHTLLEIMIVHHVLTQCMKRPEEGIGLAHHVKLELLTAVSHHVNAQI